MTDALVNEKSHILSEPTVKFFNSDPKIFEIDYRKAGTVAKAIQSRLPPVVIGKKDSRITLNNKRGGQQSSSCHGKSADHLATRQYHSRVFINSSQKDTAGVSRNNTKTRKISVSRAKACRKDSNKEASGTSRSHSAVKLDTPSNLAYMNR